MFLGSYSSSQREQTVNLLPSGFVGANPSLPTLVPSSNGLGYKIFILVIRVQISLGSLHKWPYRSRVRTLACHASDTSSNLVGAAIRGSSNGRTMLFGSIYLGSNPSPRTYLQA